MQMTGRNLQRQFLDRIPGESCRVAVQSGFFNVEPVLIRLSPPGRRGFDLPVVYNETGGHHAKGYMGAVEPVLRNRSLGNIHAAGAMHKGGGSKGRLTGK